MIDTNQYQGAASEASRLLRPSLIFVVHVVLWVPFALLVIMSFRFDRIFREFDMKRPFITDLALSGGLGVLLVLMVLLLIVDVPMLLLTPRGVARRLWNGLMIVTPLSITALAAIALFLPMIKMVAGLQR